jgi:hypothetical protein
VTGVAGLATYAVTTGAMNALTRSVAVDFGSQLIRSNAIIVGNVPVSGIVQFLANHPVAGPELLGANSIPRLGVGDDITAAAAFLVSDASAWITGSLMAADGGYNSRAPISDLSATLADYSGSRTAQAARQTSTLCGEDAQPLRPQHPDNWIDLQRYELRSRVSQRRPHRR